MHYDDYFDEIVTVHRVVLEGWPLPNFNSPASLGSAESLHRKLYDSLVIDPPSCFWRRIADDEFMELKRKNDADVAAGIKPMVKPRKTRSDAGTKRKATEDNGNTDKRQRTKAGGQLSPQFVDDDDDDDVGGPSSGSGGSGSSGGDEVSA